MKILKDAMFLLVVILIVTTVRISPLPEARLPSAQAGQSDQAAAPAVRPASAAEVETETPAVDAAPAQPDAPPTCESTLAVKTATVPAPAPDPSQNPCDA